MKYLIILIALVPMHALAQDNGYESKLVKRNSNRSLPIPERRKVKVMLNSGEDYIGIFEATGPSSFQLSNKDGELVLSETSFEDIDYLRATPKYKFITGMTMLGLPAAAVVGGGIAELVAPGDWGFASGLVIAIATTPISLASMIFLTRKKFSMEKWEIAVSKR